MINFVVYLNFLRFWPHLLIWHLSDSKNLIYEDLIRWQRILNKPNSKNINFVFVYISLFFPAFRNLFYARIRKKHNVFRHILSIIAAPQPLLDVDASDVGGGLFIQHGYATIIAAKKIGKNCWINQNVTLGYTNSTDHPTLGDNVTVYAGAKVLGNVTIGNNSIVAANAVVVKDVPDNVIVGGVPAKIIKNIPKS